MCITCNFPIYVGQGLLILTKFSKDLSVPFHRIIPGMGRNLIPFQKGLPDIPGIIPGMEKYVDVIDMLVVVSLQNRSNGHGIVVGSSIFSWF